MRSFPAPDTTAPALAALSAALARAQADIGRRVDAVGASYRAAERHRLSDSRARNHRAVAGTLDSHLRQTDRDELVARSRDAWQNYPVARSLIERHVDVVVGDGFEPQPNTGVDAVDREIKERWQEWCEAPEVTGRWNYDGLTAAAVRHKALDGACVFVLTDRGQAQLLGAQRLRNPAGAWDSLSWRGGLRLGGFGEILEMNVAEWMADGRGVRATSGRRLDVTPNYESPFLYSHTLLEDHYIGEPILAPVLEDLGQLQDLIESVNQAAHLAALLAFVHTTLDPRGTANMLGAVDQADPGSGGGTRSVAPVGDSGVYTLRPGESLTAVQGAQPTQNHADMVRLQIRQIGAALCVPLELAMLDFSVSNFHGALAAIEVCRRDAEKAQTMLVGRVHQRLYRWKVSEWSGTLPVESMAARDLYRVDWRYPMPLVLDPKRAAEVFTEMRKVGAMPLRDLRGDWAEVLEQIAREERTARELGVVVERTPGSTTAGAGEAVARTPQPTTTTNPTPTPATRPSPAPVDAAEADTEVQKLALNGAQVQSLQEILQTVSDGAQSPEMAIDLIVLAFPAIDRATVERMVRQAEAFARARPDKPAETTETTEATEATGAP